MMYYLRLITFQNMVNYLAILNLLLSGDDLIIVMNRIYLIWQWFMISKN